MSDHLITTRGIRDKVFSNEPGPTRFLRVPAGSNPAPAHEIPRTTFVGEVSGTPGAQKCEDIVVFVHGYNVTQSDLIKRHRSMRVRLAKSGYKGEVLSFDWPPGILTRFSDLVRQVKVATPYTDAMGTALGIVGQKLPRRIPPLPSPPSRSAPPTASGNTAPSLRSRLNYRPIEQHRGYHRGGRSSNHVSLLVGCLDTRDRLHSRPPAAKTT